jgi:cytoskeleton protein RodZ
MSKGTFGERMRREREMRGIKLEEITESTKISQRNLLALEEEHFDRLPGGIFNKGFVRAYARFLGLDEDQAVHDFMTASAEYDQPAALQPPPPTSVVKLPVIRSEATEKRKDLVWALAALLVLAVGGVGWYYLNYGKLPGSSRQSSARAAAPSPTSSPLPSAGQANSGPGQPAPELKGASPVVIGPAGAAQQTVVLAIRANDDSWVSMVVDGKPYLEQNLTAGTERTVQARESIVLKTGNAGALEFSYNGQPAVAAGKDGQVRTMTFTPRGVQQ